MNIADWGTGEWTALIMLITAVIGLFTAVIVWKNSSSTGKTNDRSQNGSGKRKEPEPPPPPVFTDEEFEIIARFHKKYGDAITKVHSDGTTLLHKVASRNYQRAMKITRKKVIVSSCKF